jgi:hypothetical protein
LHCRPFARPTSLQALAKVNQPVLTAPLCPLLRPDMKDAGGDDVNVAGTAILEDAVGITAFANEAPGFSGVLKERYSDFLVHEVSVATVT